MASHNDDWPRIFFEGRGYILAISFLLLPNGLERVKISKTVVKNLVYGWPLTLRCLIILVRLQSGTRWYSIGVGYTHWIFSAMTSREIGSRLRGRPTPILEAINDQLEMWRIGNASVRTPLKYHPSGLWWPEFWTHKAIGMLRISNASVRTPLKYHSSGLWWPENCS